jgi:hypothetical protein
MDGYVRGALPRSTPRLPTVEPLEERVLPGALSPPGGLPNPVPVSGGTSPALAAVVRPGGQQTPVADQPATSPPVALTSRRDAPGEGHDTRQEHAQADRGAGTPPPAARGEPAGDAAGAGRYPDPEGRRPIKDKDGTYRGYYGRPEGSARGAVDEVSAWLSRGAGGPASDGGAPGPEAQGPPAAGRPGPDAGARPALASLTSAVTGKGADRPVPATPPPGALPAEAWREAALAAAAAGGPHALARVLGGRPGTTPPPPDPGDPLAPEAPPGVPLAGAVPFDLGALQRGADAFFTRLAKLGEDWGGAGGYARLAPWLAAVTAVALACARSRKQSPRQPALADGRVPGLVGLPPGGAA